MANGVSLEGYGAALVVVAILSTAVIALGFVMPERLFESTVGLAAFLAASVLIVVCAVLANRYDLRWSLHEKLG